MIGEDYTPFKRHVTLAGIVGLSGQTGRPRRKRHEGVSPKTRRFLRLCCSPLVWGHLHAVPNRHRPLAIGLSSVRFKEVSARFPDKSAQVDDDFAFALGKFAQREYRGRTGNRQESGERTKLV